MIAQALWHSYNEPKSDISCTDTHIETCNKETFKNTNNVTFIKVGNITHCQKKKDYEKYAVKCLSAFEAYIRIMQKMADAQTMAQAITQIAMEAKKAAMQVLTVAW